MRKTRLLTVSALFAAMTYIATMFIKLPVPLTGGYVHVGDAFICLAATLLPAPYAMMSGAVGAALADATGGFYVYVIPTAIIKSLLILPFPKYNTKIICVRTVIGALIASVIGICGYFVADWAIYGSVATAAANALAGLVQPLVSLAIFILLGYAIDKANIKNLMEMKR